MNLQGCGFVLSRLHLNANKMAVMAGKDVRGTSFRILAPNVVHGVGVYRLEQFVNLVFHF